jgi:ferredoxin
MPKLSIDGNSFDVETGKRLVLAIEEAGVNIGHRCAGNAHCTTCQVVFEAGEPEGMTKAEMDLLTDRGLIGQCRLSCQITCDQDMSVKPVMLVEKEGWDSPGDTPEAGITPDPVWV